MDDAERIKLAADLQHAAGLVGAAFMDVYPETRSRDFWIRTLERAAQRMFDRIAEPDLVNALAVISGLAVQLAPGIVVDAGGAPNEGLDRESYARWLQQLGTPNAEKIIDFALSIGLDVRLAVLAFSKLIGGQRIETLNAGERTAATFMNAIVSTVNSYLVDRPTDP